MTDDTSESYTKDMNDHSANPDSLIQDLKDVQNASSSLTNDDLYILGLHLHSTNQSVAAASKLVLQIMTSLVYNAGLNVSTYKPKGSEDPSVRKLLYHILDTITLYGTS